MNKEKKAPLIQINDEIREMTSEELANYEALSLHAFSLENDQQLSGLENE
jgi:hypothetical protein